jgi:hypothetical protein
MRHETHRWNNVKATAEIVSAGVGQAGLTPVVAIQRIDTGDYLAAGGGSWVPGGPAPTNPMAAVDAADQPGLYEFDIPAARLIEVGSANPGYFIKIVEPTTPLLEYVKVEIEESVTEAAALDDIANAVWQEELAAHLGADKAGQRLTDASNKPSAADIAGEVWDTDNSLHLIGGSTGDNLNNAGGGATPAAIADAVWTEPLAEHSGTGGSTAEALANVSAGADPATIAAEVWNTTRSSHTDPNTFGLLMQVTAGMVQANHRLKNPTYDAEGRMLTAQLLVFADGATADADGVPLATFDVTMTYDGDGNLETVLSKE